VVGRKLWKLTPEHQVLCVTHLPQLASYADQHYSVDKKPAKGRTTTRVKVLDGQSRIEELASMLGGPPSEARRRSAQEMYEETLAVKTAPSPAIPLL